MIWIYLFCGIWILLGLSILFAIIAEIKKSWTIMLNSCIASLPNTIFVIVQPVNIFMYLFLVWFLIQVVILITLIKKMTLNKTRILRVSLWGAVILFLVYNIITVVPYSVNKSYKEAIYKGNQVVKKNVPVTVSGKVYRGIFKTNSFIGEIKIDGKVYSVHTFTIRRSMAGTRRVYPYGGVATDLNSQDEIITIATFKMSGDFRSMIATSDDMAKKYGRQTELRGTETSN